MPSYLLAICHIHWSHILKRNTINEKPVAVLACVTWLRHGTFFSAINLTLRHETSLLLRRGLPSLQQLRLWPLNLYRRIQHEMATKDKKTGSAMNVGNSDITHSVIPLFKLRRKSKICNSRPMFFDILRFMFNSFYPASHPAFKCFHCSKCCKDSMFPFSSLLRCNRLEQFEL